MKINQGYEFAFEERSYAGMNENSVFDQSSANVTKDKEKAKTQRLRKSKSLRKMGDETFDQLLDQDYDSEDDDQIFETDFVFQSHTAFIDTAEDMENEADRQDMREMMGQVHGLDFSMTKFGLSAA